MTEEKSLFERLDEISAGQSAIFNEITGVKTQVSDNDSKIAELEQEIQKLKSTPVIQPKPRTSTQPKNDKAILQAFLKQSKKSWRWLGSRAEFTKWKILVIVSLAILLLVGIITSIVSTICFQMYSTFTLFENAWMICGIIYLIYASRTQLTYEVNALASSSPTKYERDNLGMMFPRKEKLVFRIFKWLAIISTVCNIIGIWSGMGKGNQAAATVMEVLLLGAIIFAYFMNFYFYDQYLIIWVEGHNLTTKEKVVFVFPPGAKQLMPEEEFKKKMPGIYK